MVDSDSFGIRIDMVDMKENKAERVQRDAEVLAFQDGISLAQAIAKIIDEDVPGFGGLVISVILGEWNMLTFKNDSGYGLV